MLDELNIRMELQRKESHTGKSTSNWRPIYHNLFTRHLSALICYCCITSHITRQWLKLEAIDYFSQFYERAGQFLCWFCLDLLLFLHLAGGMVRPEGPIGLAIGASALLYVTSPPSFS